MRPLKHVQNGVHENDAKYKSKHSWPDQSPDFNLIEMLWSDKSDMHKQMATNLDKLKQYFEEERTKILTK